MYDVITIPSLLEAHYERTGVWLRWGNPGKLPIGRPLTKAEQHTMQTQDAECRVFMDRATGIVRVRELARTVVPRIRGAA